MKDRISVLQTMIDTGVVAVMRTSSSQELVDVARALREGGVVTMEVTMTTPGALEAISNIAKVMGDQVIIGAGTVLDTESCRAALLAGAQFIVCPVLLPSVIDMCHRYDKVVVPGAFTPTEIYQAWDRGADAVKVFPATALGPQYFRDLKGPFPQIRLTPTGGVSLENAGDFIKAGASFVGVGGNLLDKKAIAAGQWNVLTETAAKYIAAVKGARAR
ncbi:MAG: bifunctional 4-hydroxy-2-oxoglutarate aldolase/2-dehydro-3-deoxy-phosphogluconate aldolase [Chitinophagales bacterium]